MKISERRQKILDKILQDGEVKVDQLMKEFHVSVETIRRDLRILDHQGYVTRKYGGAVKRIEKAKEVPYADRLVQYRREKEAIAKEAVKLLQDGDSLFIDGKTSALTFAYHIPDDLELTIVTNSIVVAHELIQHRPKCSVFTCGGKVDEGGLLTGPRVNQGLRDFQLDKAFFSAIAVDEKGCYYTRSEPQELAQTLKEVCSDLILLADSSKMNKIAFLFGLAMSDLDVIVTDEGVPESFVKSLKSSTTELVVAPLDSNTAIEEDAKYE